MTKVSAGFCNNSTLHSVPPSPRLDGASYEVMQLEFEVDNVINLVPTQTLHWMVEYPAGLQAPPRQAEKVSHLYISNADVQGIVPLAEVTPRPAPIVPITWGWGGGG